MKRTIAFALLSLLLIGAGMAHAATQIGVRGGWSHASGNIFDGSGDVGGGGIYGIAVSMGIFPAVDVEFAYERYTNEFTFERAAYEDVFFGGEGTFENQAYIFTGKLNLTSAVNPLGFYGGGGFSLHEMDLEIESTDESVGDYLDRIGGDRSDWEWHLVGGVGVRILGLPLRAYAEYRYQNVQGDDNPSYSSIYAGLNLFLK